jgi:hypothetical protein
MPGRCGSCGEIDAENGPIAEGKITSDITVSSGPPWNSIGVVMPLSFDPMVERHPLAQAVSGRLAMNARALFSFARLGTATLDGTLVVPDGKTGG